MEIHSVNQVSILRKDILGCSIVTFTALNISFLACDYYFYLRSILPAQL